MAIAAGSCRRRSRTVRDTTTAMPNRSVVATCLSMLTACAGESEPPVVANLTMMPQTIPVGVQSTVTGTMSFTDGDGDVDQIAAAITLPGSPRTELDPVPVQTMGGDTEGTVNYGFVITPPIAGTYVIELWLIDDDDHVSNTLAADLVVQ
jgi:hypothetical protein